MMNEIERVLRRLVPPAAPAELRGRVLCAVANELSIASRPASRLQFRPGLTVAACLVASIALNYWIGASLDRRIAAVLGPKPVRRQAAEIATEIAAVTELSTGKRAYDRLTFQRPQADGVRQYAVRLRRLVQELTVDHKDAPNEAHEKNPEVDRDRRSSRDHLGASRECLVRLEHRNAAGRAPRRPEALGLSGAAC